MKTHQRLAALDYKSFVAEFDKIACKAMADLTTRASGISTDFAQMISVFGDLMHHSPYKRPYFAYLGYLGFWGSSFTQAAQVAIALELYDAALLIHDDIIDGDDMRNGHPNLLGRYAQTLRQNAHLSREQAQKTAASISLIGGDTLYGIAFEALVESSISEAAKQKVLKTLFDTHLILNAGQYEDIVCETRTLAEVNESSIINSYLLKNQFNIEMPLKAGAYGAGGDTHAVERLCDFAFPLGAAIQIVNDIDVLFSDRYDTKTTADLRGNKKTLIMWYAWQMANYADRQFIISCLGSSEVDHHKLHRIKQLIKKTGAKRMAYNKGAEFIHKAAKALEKDSQLRPDAKQRLYEFVDSIAIRLA